MVDTTIVALFELIGGINNNALLYLLHAIVLSPACFILVNYLIIKKIGADNIKTTGDSMMYSLGYSSAFNILSTGIIAFMYFLTMLDIRNRGGSYIVVSDADYVSVSDTVSGSNLLSETIYGEMMKLCSQPVSYYMTFVFNCLWVFAVFAAVMPVIWLAATKENKPLILAFAFIIRLFITLPDILDHFKVIGNVWVSHLISVAVLVIIWIAAMYCRKLFIDTDDAVSENDMKKKSSIQSVQ